MRALASGLVSSLLLALALASCSSSSSPDAASPGTAGAAGAGGSDAAGGGGSPGFGGQTVHPMISPGIEGVYVISPRLTTGGPTITDDVYALPTFDGAVIRLRWDALQPKAGMYDFYELDTELERARDAGKKVALALLAGSSTPPWVYDVGMASELVFVIPGADASGSDCESIHVPAPWDMAFQTAFTAAIAQIGLHLSEGSPAILDGVRMVLVTGIGADAEDLELPKAGGGMTAGGCQLTDTNTAWKTAGYRPSKVRDAWTALLASYSQAFPTTMLLAPTVRAGFPGIDDSGAIVDPATVDPTASLLDIGTTMLPGRFAAQGDGLTVDSTDASIASAIANGAIGGFRTNDFLGKNGAGCGSDDPTMAVTCTDSGYGNILHHGVDLGGKFLSIRVVEVSAFPGSVEDAETALRGGP